MSMKLLIVDDESDVREFAANFFRKRKFEVSTASSGEEALKAAEIQQPNIVILDIKMSGMDGIEVLRKLKELNKRIKVIMITGRNDEEAKKETSELGACGYLHKPLELDELMGVVIRMRGRADD